MSGAVFDVDRGSSSCWEPSLHLVASHRCARKTLQEAEVLKLKAEPLKTSHVLRPVHGGIPDQE